MDDILYVKKKVGESYLVWFQNSNLYFSLKEPAWFVFKKIVKKQNNETIAKEFSLRYSLNFDESLNFIHEIKQKISEMNHPFSYPKYHEVYKNEINEHIYEPYSSHVYNLFNGVVKFSYETSWLESYIHPMIEQLMIIDEITDKSHFELFTYKDRIILRVNQILKGSWKVDESEYVKGRIFVELINVLHNKSETDWLMTVHASAISNGKKTILFSAAPGSGKTTIAALLRANGYHIISDDFVPIEQSSFKAYPLPIAMSVKEGSLDLLKSNFPELVISPLVTVNENKKVRYLPVDIGIMKMIFPVKEFIFIKYDKSVDFQLKKIKPLQGLKKLLDEAWIPATPDNVEIFLDKILKASYYNLIYSNNKKALDAITQLFEND